MSDREPDWVRHAMWWQIYPLGFTGAPVRPETGERTTDVVHRLGRVEAWLDHLVETGLNGLLLGPIFASSSHGYDTVDYFRVDPRLGDDGDFDRLVAAARERGIRILLDGVFNHVGWGHPAFQALVAKVRTPRPQTCSWSGTGAAGNPENLFPPRFSRDTATS